MVIVLYPVKRGTRRDLAHLRTPPRVLRTLRTLASNATVIASLAAEVPVK